MKIEKGKEYAIVLLECLSKSDSEGGWTAFEVSPPLDADHDGSLGHELLIRGDHSGRTGLIVVKWTGAMRLDMWRIWEEVKGECSNG